MVSQLLCTACNDSNIRVFNVLNPGQAEILTLQGHASKVFNVCWSLVVNDLLASSSDDTTVIVWTLSQKNLLANKSNAKSSELNLHSSFQLFGHTNKTRAILFPLCLPNHLLSGGWDKTIRLWHLPSRSCVFFCSDHQSDVYGLLSHFERPAIIVSCSRDSTIRVWSLEEKIKEKIWMEMLERTGRNENDFKVIRRG